MTDHPDQTPPQSPDSGAIDRQSINGGGEGDIPPEPVDELESFIWQTITDYISTKNMGHTTGQSIESTIAYDLPNLEQLIASRIRALVDELGADGPENWLADPKYRNLVADKYNSTAYFEALGHDKCNDQWRALLAQKRGEL